jgi:hypothetical protein
MSETDKRVKAHTTYEVNGVKVPGVTTIINATIPKPALVPWAWKQGKEGVAYDKLRDREATVGTLAHELVRCHQLGEKPDTTGYAPQDIDRAETAFLNYLEWEKHNAVDTILTETPLTSKVTVWDILDHKDGTEEQVPKDLGFGGTIDKYGMVNGKPTLIDIKSGSGIYRDARIQVSAYRTLLIENGHDVEKVLILRIPKDGEGLQTESVSNDKLDVCWRIFERCIQVYHDLKLIGK